MDNTNSWKELFIDIQQIFVIISFFIWGKEWKTNDWTPKDWTSNHQVTEHWMDWTPKRLATEWDWTQNNTENRIEVKLNSIDHQIGLKTKLEWTMKRNEHLMGLNRMGLNQMRQNTEWNWTQKDK